MASIVQSKHRPRHTAGMRMRPLALACLLACAAAPQAQAANCNAADVATLNTCLSTTGNGDTITLTASIIIPNGTLTPVNAQPQVSP